eukprot:Colp12_sorted_trinity150504_noHs@26487
MHERNIYFNKRPNFRSLAEKYPEFANFVSGYPDQCSIDYKDPAALRELTYVLLSEDFGIKLQIPLDKLIPTVPNRLDYILWISDLIDQKTGEEVKGIDIGTGASCIYPLLGHRLNGWKFLATDIQHLQRKSTGYIHHI